MRCQIRCQIKKQIESKDTCQDICHMPQIATVRTTQERIILSSRVGYKTRSNYSIFGGTLWRGQSWVLVCWCGLADLQETLNEPRLHKREFMVKMVLEQDDHGTVKQNSQTLKNYLTWSGPTWRKMCYKTAMILAMTCYDYCALFYRTEDFLEAKDLFFALQISRERFHGSATAMKILDSSGCTESPFHF